VGDKRKMRKISFVLIAVFIVSILSAGCGIRQKIEQKVSEKIVEGLVEKALSSENAKVDIDNGKVTVKTDSGGTFSVGTGSWPDVDYLPEFKKGEIMSTTDTGTGDVTILFSNVEEKDFKEYLAIIKKEFPENAFDYEAEGLIVYEGKNSNGNKVALDYDRDEKVLVIAGIKQSN